MLKKHGCLNLPVRLRVVPHFCSGIVERAKRERAWKSPHTRKGDTRLAWGDFHARWRFARSTIPEEKWGTTGSLTPCWPVLRSKRFFFHPYMYHPLHFLLCPILDIPLFERGMSYCNTLHCKPEFLNIILYFYTVFSFSFQFRQVKYVQNIIVIFYLVAGRLDV